MGRPQTKQIARDFLILVSGAGAGQLVALAVTPIMTRLILPEDMGVFGVYTTIVAILTIFASLGFETAIIGSRDEDTSLLVGIVVIASALIASAAAAITFVLLISGVVYGLPLWIPLLILVDTFLANSFMARQFWCVREHNFRPVSLGLFTSYSGRGLFATFLATILPGKLALVFGNVAGRLLALAVIDHRGFALRAARKALSAPRAAWDTARRYRKAMFFVMPSTLLQSMLSWLPVLLSSATFGMEAAGYVALSHRVQGAVLSLLSRATGDIYQSRITGHGATDPSKLSRVTSMLVFAILLISVPFCALLVLFGKIVFSTIFGDNWATVGVVISILAPMAAFQLCGSIISRMLIEINRQEVILFSQIASLVVMLISFALGHFLQWDITKTLIIFSLSSCLILATWAVLSLLICRLASPASLPEIQNG